MKAFEAFKEERNTQDLINKLKKRTLLKIDTLLMKSMELFSSCHLKLLAMVRAKASSFLEQPKRRVRDH